MLPFDQVFFELVGQWDLHKTISNGASYRGQAQFSHQSHDILLLEETGILTLENTLEIQGQRRWLWEISSESHVNIKFDEPIPRLYHDLDFMRQDEVWKASAQHLCSPDIYDGHYVISDEKIDITQDVKGPSKDYRMISKLKRI